MDYFVKVESREDQPQATRRSNSGGPGRQVRAGAGDHAAPSRPQRGDL